MMGYRKLWIALLLSSCVMAQDSSGTSEQTSACLLASRFKANKKYFYQYTTESSNGVVGTASGRNGPKVSCQVEIEVPQTCRFIMTTSDCELSEASDMDPAGQPVFTPAPTSKDFKVAMEKNPLKVTVEDGTHVHLYPETDEPVNILNVKRGIVSALVVPHTEDRESRVMSTVHGLCLTDNVVPAVPTSVSLSRDLSQCDHFYSRELANSPLALIQRLHLPLSKLITSTQDCDYEFDNKGKHVTTATCTEKHVYLPFSYEDNGISSVVTQKLNLQSSKRSNFRDFDVDPNQSRPLHFENSDDKASVQTKDTVLSTLQELQALPRTDEGQKRPSLFHKLVSSLRALRNETLSQMLNEMLDTSTWLTWQALLQCGTSECTSAILQAVRTIDGVSLEVDALVYGLSLQSNPDRGRVRDMLSMAQYKQSKAIMYALANTVKKFHKDEVTPEVTDVSKFMETLLNDCSGETLDIDSDLPSDPDEVYFLVLRVVGVMGEAMQAVSPSLISSVLKCAKKLDAPLSNQKAAIQAFRLMDIDDEIRNVLMEVFRDPRSAAEKRIAAYLILMKSPHPALVRDIEHSLDYAKDEQVKNFVVSHLKNILTSNEPQLQTLREYIASAMADRLPSTKEAFSGMSRNYKVDSALGSVQTNIIFDGKDTLPKEVLLETTLKVFDYNYDIFEVAVDGTGFEPTIEAFFGEKGFFPDSTSKMMYWAENKAGMLRDVLEKIAPGRDRRKRQLPQDLLKDISNNIEKLASDLQSSQSPEAIAYLRLLGNEIGYMKTSEIRKMAETLSMYYHVFFNVLPYKFLNSIMTNTDNQVFGHYIFMENTFSLPTASGLPLKFSLAGVVTPGAKGGIAHAVNSGMTGLSFMPSVGLEFITQMGVYIPEYVEAAIEMHTNAYHESPIHAEVIINRDQVKLSVPAPKSNIQLFTISNELLSVSSGKTTTVPSLVPYATDSTDCQSLFSGLKLCTKAQYSHATSVDKTPYYPLTGETRFALEIQPTGEVSEYTVTIEPLREGKQGRRTVDSLKITFKAEGDDSTEATATLKYNRHKDILTADIVIPDFDVEAGIKLTVTDSDAKGKKMRGIAIDVTNKNIPQLNLVGRTRLNMMKDAMVQLEMNIPSLKTDASVTATLKRDENLLVEVETAVTFPETSYQQKTSLRYDDDNFEMELKSDLNSELHKLIPGVEDYHEQLQQLLDDMLDQKVPKTDMKLRHIVTKGIQAGNQWLDKFAAHIPYLVNLRSKRSISDFSLPSLPEKLFLQSDSLFRYQFNKDKMAISLPVPLGGQMLKELNIPTSLSLPDVEFPGIGLHIPANTYSYSLPSFTIPSTLDFTVPLLGLAEASTKINSNYYMWEGSISGGNSTVDVPSYIVQCKALAQSPFNLLSYKLEGTGLISGRAADNLKYLLNTSFSHCLIDTSFSVVETLRVTNKMNARANYRIEASSPIGLQALIHYSAQATSTLDSDEVSGDGTVDGFFKFGPLYTNTSYTHSYNLRPRDRKGRGESTLLFDSPLLHIHNTIHGVYANSELNIVSKTNIQKDILKHMAELKYKDSQLILKCNTMASVMGKSLNNKVEVGVSRQMGILRIESQADDDKNRAYSLITGSLGMNGLEMNSEGSLILDVGRGLHKASLVIGENGLTTSGTNSIQCSPVTMENIFNGVIDSDGATMSCRTKAIAEESRGELNIEGKATGMEASLDGILKGHIYGVNTRNNVNVLLNRRGLTLTGDSLATLKQLKTENSHTLTLTLWTLALKSRTNNIICEDIYYKHNINVDMKPFVMSSDMTHDLKFNDVDLTNEGHLKVEPNKMALGGSTKGAYKDDHNIKHTYEITYEDLAGTAKSITSGDIMNAQISHDCDFEFAGLSSKSKCQARINSEPLRFDGTLRTMALPFSITIDALVNSDGEIKMHGKHSGQLYSKLLVKAEPLALAHYHDTRVSTMHVLPSGDSMTMLDNKLDGLLTPSDQNLNWKVKSKLNNHAYNQDISAYNNPEKTGFEISGALFTDIFSKLYKDKGSLPEIQEFSTSGFLKYDKISDCHIINIPFIESFIGSFEKLKNTFVNALESFQKFIINLDIKPLIRDFTAMLMGLPEQVSDLMKKIDLDNKVDQLKAKLDYMMNEFSITLDDLELSIEDFSKKLENTVIDFATKIKELIVTIKDFVKDGHLGMRISDILSKIGNHLQAFDDKYHVKQSFVKVLLAIEDIIGQIDLQKLTDASTEWLRNLDSKYGLLEKIKDKLSGITQKMESFDIKKFLQNVSDYLNSIDLDKYVDKLYFTIPTSEMAHVIDSIKDVIVNWIDEYEIPNKLNAVYSYIKDIFLRYNLDDEFKELMDQIVILIKELKIKETVQSMVDALKSINFEFVYNEMMQVLDTVTMYLKQVDIKTSIDNLNEHISSVLGSMKHFDYGKTVDKVNAKIADLTNYINDQIKTYEIVEKIEAVREFFREIQSSIYSYLDQLKNTKVADALKKLANVINTTFYNDVKIKVQDMLADMKQRVIDMDVRDEMYIHLKRISESYSNVVAYIKEQFKHLAEKVKQDPNSNDIINQILDAVLYVLDALKKAQIKIGSFTLPFTDLVIPAFTIDVNKLHEITIPNKISVPEFTILNYTFPGFTIDFDDIKAETVAIIDHIRTVEIKMPDPEKIFGDLKVLSLLDLPDLTFPEITLSEIRVPTVTIPKLNLKDFEITMLPIPEIKLPKITSDICIPVFGELNGEFRLNFPHYSLVTTGKIQNSTSSPKNPQFIASINSNVKSSIEPLEYTFDASAQLGAPRLKKLQFTETVKATHKAFNIDHEGSLMFTGSFVESSAKTTAKAATPVYTADLVNNMAFTLKSGISATMDTIYNHNVNIPLIETMCQASVKQNIAATVDSDKVTLKGDTTGSGKWSIYDYSDEGTHNSSLDFNLNFNTAKLTFVEDTDCTALKSKKTLTIKSVSLSHIDVDARCETDIPSFKKSVMVLNGVADTGDLKIAVTASHNSEFTGCLTGSMSNSVEFLIHPFEILLDVKNKVNSKIFFPLKLTGKLDLVHDCGVIVNSDKQHASCSSLARFNQYKYSHNFTAENNENEKFLHSTASGEANLHFLTVPLSIPSIKVSCLDITLPEVKDFSLWEQAGLRHLLITPQQSFDMGLKLHYYKNPETHSIELHLEPIYNTISDQAICIQGKFEKWRDIVVALLKDSYNQAKSQYIKHKIDTSGLPPRIFTVPGFKIPILNIYISAFRAEMPAFSYFVPKEVSTPSFKVPALGFSVPSYTLVLPSLSFPVIHVPDKLSEIKLPTFTMPAIQNNIVIPLLGNLTGDFSFKSPLITFNANIGLYNQSDIAVRFGALSTSTFDILNGRIDGTTSLTRRRGIKLACTATIKHKNVEMNHECALSLTKKNIEASITKELIINLPFFNLELKEELVANPNIKPAIAANKKIKYMFNIPFIESVGKGNLDIHWQLDDYGSDISLDISTNGKSDMTLFDGCNFVGDIENEASFFLNANQLRSTIRTVLNSLINKQTKKRSVDNHVLQFDLNNNVALEVSLKRIYATIDYSSNNDVNLASVNTNGTHTMKGGLEFVPLTTVRATLDVDVTQPFSFGHAGLMQSINLAMSSEGQTLTWTCKEQLSSLIHACDFFVSNDESEIRVDLTESAQGHVAFLKAVKLPVYQRTLWDVLKFDQVTNKEDLQFLNVSYSIVYTKAMEGLEFSLPFELSDSGITFSVPEIHISLPSWLEEMTHTLRDIDMSTVPTDIPDHFTLPHTFSTPAFNLPLTNLHVASVTIDPKNINIPKVITTMAFDILLPVLPRISVPSYNINTEYLKRKMSFLVLKVPRHDITVSSFSLPKEVTIGQHTINFKDMLHSFSNFDHPNIEFREQKIEIPDISFYLPLSVFIPAFGSLSTTVKVSSPIYTISTTANFEKKDSNLVTSLNSTCTSTMVFLEYDLSTSATFGFDNGVLSVNGKCNLVHNDVNVNCQQILAQNLRVKRQAPLERSMESLHTLNVDITSRTFTDVSFRFASRKDGITASASSPSSGFLGLQFLKRSPSQLHTKLFSRYLSTPQKDTDIFIAKASLKNPQKLMVQMSWNWDFIHDAIEGTKDRVPAMNNAVLKFVNKYHTAHFGFDLNRGSMKLKNTLSSAVVKAYSQVPVFLDEVQSSVIELGDQGRHMYKKTSDRLIAFSAQDFMDSLGQKATELLRDSDDKISSWLDTTRQFLSDTVFNVPGSDESLELFRKARRSLSEAADRAIERFVSLLKKIPRFFRGVEFTIPGTEIVVNGNKIIDKLESSVESAFVQLRRSLSKGLDLLSESVNNLSQVIAEKAEYFVKYLQDENNDIAPHVDAILADIQKLSKLRIEEAKKNVAECKDVTKLKIQEAYNSITTEGVNNGTVEVINILQSHLYGGLNEFVDLMRQTSESTAPYVNVSTKKADFEIPLPFRWKSFSQWPAQ